MQEQYAVKVESLSKVFHNSRQKNLQIIEEKNATSPFFTDKNTQTKYIALNNLSFEIKQGEVLGIIGENGAGKSTLLKILAGITKPSSGKIFLRGKVASILEMGFGFHPDLSGRDNVFASGSLLEKSVQEIEKSFQEIVAFSGLEKFIDIPVKYYSSGMFMRLAFSAATHFNADIILLDEIFSVGDIAFRAKCNERIQQLKAQGKTIVLVSHELSSISGLCSSCMALREGGITDIGPAKQVVEKYVETWLSGSNEHANGIRQTQLQKNNGRIELSVREQPAKDIILIQSIEVTNGYLNGEFKMTDNISISLCYQKQVEKGTRISVHVNDSSGNSFMGLSPYRIPSNGNCNDDSAAGNYTARTILPSSYFNVGLFTIDVVVIDENEEVLAHLSNVCYFKINLALTETDQSGYSGNFPGPLMPALQWTIDKEL